MASKSRRHYDGGWFKGCGKNIQKNVEMRDFSNSNVVCVMVNKPVLTFVGTVSAAAVAGAATAVDVTDLAGSVTDVADAVTAVASNAAVFDAR